MQDFLVFYAPFIVLILSIVAGFWISLKDGAVTKDEQK